MDYLLANSGCSGGCESGWTLYLDNSFVSPSYYNGNGFVGGGKSCGFSEEKRIILKDGAEEEEEEEEDLSMVSDASSGPPQYFAEEEDYVANDSNSCYYKYNAPVAAFSKNSAKIKKAKENRHRQVHDHHNQPSSLLDDTASSPVFDISNNNFPMANNHESAENVLDFSQGYSTTHFEESSAYQHQHGFFHSSLSGNYLQKNQWFQGRR